MASPIMAEVIARLLHSGDLLRQVHLKRAAAAGALQQVDRGTLGIRLCLGHPASDDILDNALSELKRILESAEAISFV